MPEACEVAGLERRPPVSVSPLKIPSRRWSNRLNRKAGKVDGRLPEMRNATGPFPGDSRESGGRKVEIGADKNSVAAPPTKIGESVRSCPEPAPGARDTRASPP